MTPGTYTGEMATGSFGGGVQIEKALTIECFAADHSCILDGENDHRVVMVYFVSSGTTNLIGLKITRGSSNSYGGGMYIRYSDATITSCIISDNDANGDFSTVSTRGEVYLNSLLFVRTIN